MGNLINNLLTEVKFTRILLGFGLAGVVLLMLFTNPGAVGWMIYALFFISWTVLLYGLATESIRGVYRLLDSREGFNSSRELLFKESLMITIAGLTILSFSVLRIVTWWNIALVIILLIMLEAYLRVDV